MKLSIIEINACAIVEKKKNLSQTKAERVLKNLRFEQGTNLYLCFETHEVKEWQLPIAY